MSKFKIFSIIFFTALLVECAAVAFKFERLHLISKPSLMLILLAYFLTNAPGIKRTDSTKYIVAAALFCSWLGDIFLLFDRQNPKFFIFGLGAFLAAHFFYIWYFYRIGGKNRVERKLKILPTALVAIYVVALFVLLSPGLGGLRVPVAVYALALASMLIAGLHAFDFSKHDFAVLCVAGAFLFVVSDSLLAVNRFYHTFPAAAVLIMLTYGIAQFALTVGAMRNLAWLSEKKSSVRTDDL